MIKLCEARLDEGSAPTFLGAEALLGLMHDKLVRYATFKNYGEIVALAGDALMLLVVTGREAGVGPLKSAKVQQAQFSASSEQASPEARRCAVCGDSSTFETETLSWLQPVCVECYQANGRDLLFSQIGSIPNEGIQEQ